MDAEEKGKKRASGEPWDDKRGIKQIEM